MNTKPHTTFPQDQRSKAHWWNMSLRNRIALYYTTATAVLILLVFTAIYFTVDRVVYRHVDEELQHEVAEMLPFASRTGHDIKEFALFLEREINDDDSHKERKQHHHLRDERSYHWKKKKRDVDPEFVQLANSSGAMMIKSTNLNQNMLPTERHRSGISFFNSHVGNSTVRQVQVPLFNSSGAVTGYLLVAVPMKNAIIVLRDLQDIFLVAFPLIILTLFVLTRSIAGRSIRPIEKVIATAEQMSQTKLDQRIPLPNHRDELYRLVATINALFGRMQDAFQREKNFTADASHELKTPLAVVKGTLEVLVRKPREREHYEAKIHLCLNELNRMGRMLEQLLLLARHESSTMQPHIETLILSHHLNNVVERVRSSAQAKGIAVAVTCADSTTVAADAGMVEMMVENIVSNAVKYSLSGSSITIAVEQSGNTVTCSISDQGIGIPEEKLHAIFDRFYRVDESRTSSTGGLGLGLSIVKKLANLQHIKVSVASALGEGTTFQLRF